MRISDWSSDVCSSDLLCEDSEGAPAGRHLYEVLLAATSGSPDIGIAPVDCFAVCERPVTLAFQGAGRWSYLVGGADPQRSEERRVGKEGVSTCRSRWSPYH